MNRLARPARWVGLLIPLFALALGGVGSARAHAALLQAQPAAGSVLAESPSVVALEFTEALDAGATAVELRDAQGQIVVAGPGEIDPADPRRWRLSLSPLPDGAYSAVWQARSAVDGHITRGTVAFAVGADAQAPSMLPPPGAPEPATARPPATDTLLRWLNYLAAATAVGGLLFGPLVWRPAYRRWPAATPDSDDRATALLRRLAWAGGALWAAATLLLLVAQAAQLQGGSLPARVLAIAAGRGGLLVGARLGLLLLLILFAPRLPLAGRGRRAPWLLLAGVGAAALLTISLQSHSAALSGTQATVATALDWLHLLAMAAWMGGLLPLAVLLWRERAQPGLTAALIPRFSLVALPSVLVLAGTGLVSSLTHVRTLEALTATTHGRALLLKLGLFALLLALGAVNLLWLTPQLRRAEAPAGRRFWRTVRLELLLGLALLLAVGVMTGVAPAFEALQEQQRLGFREAADDEDVRLVLRVAPLHVGDNEFAVDVADERPGAAQVSPQVLLRFQSDDPAMGVFQVEAQPAGGDRYLARGAYLSVAGPWQIEVILRRAGFDDVVHTFDLAVEVIHPAGAGHPGG